MARSFKRDKIGRFASTGGGGGGTTAKSVQVSRSRKTRLGLETSGNKTRASRSTEILGSKRRGNKVSGVTAKSMMDNAGGRQNASGVRTERTGKYLHGANKVMGNTVRAASSSGASGRGKSLRQEVKAKTSVGGSVVRYRNKNADKYASNPSVSKADTKRVQNRTFLPAKNSRAANTESIKRYNTQMVSTSRRRRKK